MERLAMRLDEGIADVRFGPGADGAEVPGGDARAIIRASVIGACRRQIGYELLGYEAAPASETSLFLCSVGGALHEMVLRSLVGLGWIRARLGLDAEGRLVWEQDGDSLSGCELGFVDEERRLMGHPDA